MTINMKRGQKASKKEERKSFPKKAKVPSSISVKFS
jgi:hypothetical protein